MGTLYLVATPIGNLDDITLRALHMLESVPLIAAEDTRHTMKLLTHFGLRKQLISLHAKNEARQLQTVVARLEVEISRSAPGVSPAFHARTLRGAW